MKYLKLIRVWIITGLALIMLTMPLAASGCTGTAVSGIAATELAATMVPPVDLDFYIYVNQQVYTRVPKSLTGALSDISVQSLAIWGVANGDNQYSVSGALTFTSAAEAKAVFTQIPAQTNIYTKLSDKVIYFVGGAGGPAQSIKNAVDNNNLKVYDDKVALTEVSHLPSSGATRPGIIGVIKPTNAALKVIKQHIDQNTASTIDRIYADAKPKTVVLGVFGSQPVDFADLVQRISNNTIWDMDLGIVLTMGSTYPGVVFSPIANRIISNQGFPERQVGTLTAFKDNLDIGNGKTIPVYLNVSGNHIFAAASGKDSYAQTLLTGINR
jgi:hypothetical protein